MFTEIFDLLKINESTGSAKDEKVQRRTAEVYSIEIEKTLNSMVYSENLSNTKLCHSSSTRESRAEEKSCSLQQKTLRESITILI